jgi:TonB family protein
VDFYANDKLIGSASDYRAERFYVTWREVTPGQYTLKAIAVNDLGVSASSKTVNITVATGTYWRTYTVKDEEFSVSLPFWPAITTSNGLRKGDGKLRLQHLLKTSYGGVDYSIETFENPEPRQSLEQFLAEQGIGSGYDPGTKRKLTIGGFAGIEYSSSSNTSPARAQFFATEEHLYRFVASGPSAGHPSIDELFFSSIKLGKNPDGNKLLEGPGAGLPLQADTGERVFLGKEVDTKARLLTKPEPTYSNDDLKNKIVGTVVLRVVFSKTGKVNTIRVVSGMPYGITETAIEAAKKIKFIPAMKDGEPVSMWMQLEYYFDLSRFF